MSIDEAIDQVLAEEAMVIRGNHTSMNLVKGYVCGKVLKKMNGVPDPKAVAKRVCEIMG